MIHITRLYGMEKYASMTLSAHLDIEKERVGARLSKNDF